MRKSGLVESLIITVVASLILIAMGLIYLILSLWIVKFSSGLMGLTPDSNYVIISASVIVSGIMIGSAIKNG